ncbi:RTA1-domain-containing protein [Stipitochalara longipes BDJ]|nr:RTA1-domain-containing protein [Stipitochalara longipes BDJ]
MEALAIFLEARAKHNAKGCTKETCPVEDSVYGYYPSLPINAILTVLFGISLFLHVFQGIKSRSWSFMTALAIGITLEAIGYVGRLLLRSDPFSKAYIGIQLICLTVAPAFLSAGIYLTLKHITIVYGREYSRLAPKMYTWIFISCDIVSILIQTAGTTIAASANSSNLGNDIILVGLVTQVITLSIFGLLAMDVWARIIKNNGYLSTTAKEVHNTRRFKGVIGAIVLAYTFILIRCVYRIPEMAGGWSNKVMQDQTLFIILDGVMCIVAVLALNAFHPGLLFKQSYATSKAEGRESSELPMV